MQTISYLSNLFCTYQSDKLSHFIYNTHIYIRSYNNTKL